MDDPISEPPDRSDEYAALIKPGDAIETPDGELWVVERVLDAVLTVISAHRDPDGLVYADVYEPATTQIPTTLAHKAADARQVRRP